MRWRLPSHDNDAMILADAFVSQQQTVNERLLTAAKYVQSKLVGQGVCEELDDAITAAEAEIEERRKPITREWLQSIGSKRVSYTQTQRLEYNGR